MSRYNTARVKRRKTTKNSKNQILRYETTIYKSVPEKDDDMYVITQHGDRLDNLAATFYGDSSYWWFIAHVNGISTLNVPVGTSIRIPSSTIDAESK